MENFNFKINIFLLGDINTGKTLFFKKFNQIDYNNYIPTIGIEIENKIIKFGSKKISFNFIDTCGAEFNENSFKYHLNSNPSAVILFYNLNQKQSFLSIKNWLKNVHIKKDDNNSKKNYKFPIFIIGNINKQYENNEYKDEDLINEYMENFFYKEINLKNENNIIDNYFTEFYEDFIKTYYNIRYIPNEKKSSCLLF